MAQRPQEKCCFEYLGFAVSGDAMDDKSKDAPDDHCDAFVVDLTPSSRLFVAMSACDCSCA